MKSIGLNVNKVFVATQVRHSTQWVVACLLLLLAGAGHATANFPQLTGRIVDQANLLSEQQQTRLTSLLAQHEEKTSNQIVIVTLLSLQDHDIADYGVQLGRYWGIGQKDKNNGVLFIIAPEQRKVRIEVGYGLEGALTDVLSQHIIQAEIIPHFRDDDFAKGIEAGTKAILEAVVGEYQPKPLQTQASNRSYIPDWNGIKSLFYFIVIIGIVLGFLLKRNAITTSTIHRILSAIIPMYIVIWLLSASLYTTSVIVWIFTFFYVTPWTAKWISTMTLALSVIANVVTLLGFLYLLEFQTGTAIVATVAIAIFVVFPVTHYKLPIFQIKYAEKLLPNSLFWCAVASINIATVWLLEWLLLVLMDQLAVSGVDSKLLVYGVLLTPLIVIIPFALYQIFTGKARLRTSNSRSRNDYQNNYSSSTSSSSSSSSSVNSGGGNFGGGGSSGSW
jgi:uncharacterized protein